MTDPTLLQIRLSVTGAWQMRRTLGPSVGLEWQAFGVRRYTMGEALDVARALPYFRNNGFRGVVVMRVES